VIVACCNQSTGSFVFLRRALGELCSQSQIKHVSALKLLSLCYKRTGSCFQLCVYRLMDALGKFGEHSRIQSYPRLRVKQLLCFFSRCTNFPCASIACYIITQVLLAFWLFFAYSLLEDRRTIDVIISKFFPLCLKWLKALRI